jgi:hypothetical protein
MWKKLFLISLIFLTPVHSLAALQMPFEHQSRASITNAEDATQYSCHQDMANISIDEDHSVTQASTCNACTLCMAFGFSPLHLAMMPNHFSMSFNTVKKTSFISHDSSGLNKPPIL